MPEVPPCSAMWHTLPAPLKFGVCPACGRDKDGAVPDEPTGPPVPPPV